ncbi:MAG: type II toxin-antitoxin system HicB family antitoxin [Chloroflexota bacterium]
MAVRADQYTHPASGRFVVLTCNVQPSGDLDDVSVAVCPSLGVISQGDSLAEAENNIREAVCLYLRD